MQATDEHTKAHQNGMLATDRSKRRSAGPNRAPFPTFQLHDRKDGLLPPGSQDLEERVRCLQEEDTPLGCKCRNSRCLKLYCVCFAARKFCDGCACIDCGNTEENVAEVHKRRHKVNVKNPHAFQDKKNPIVAKGCNCLKSRCLKGYCECYAASRGCMPICCCKDCENVFGVRPGIDDQILSHRRMSLYNYDGTVESDEEGSQPPPGRCAPHHWPEFELHPQAHVAHTTHAVHNKQTLNAVQAVRAGRPAASDSSEPPHQDLLNLVAAAEQLEHDTGLEIPCSDTGNAPRWHPPDAGKRGHRDHAAAPDVYEGKPYNLVQPLFKAVSPTARRSAAPSRRTKASSLDHARPGRVGATNRSAPHGEQSAIRTMHSNLLHRVSHRPHPTSSAPGLANEDGSPLEENSLLSPVRTCKGGATPHPVKLVRSPEGLHLTVASAPSSCDDAAALDESNPGGGVDVFRLSGAAASHSDSKMMPAQLSDRQPDVITNILQAHHSPDVPMEESNHEKGKEGHDKEAQGDDEELQGMLSFPSTQENNALAAAQAVNDTSGNAHVPNGTSVGVDLHPCAGHKESRAESETRVTLGGAENEAERITTPKVEPSCLIPPVCEQAATAMDDSAGSKLQALLVTMLPGGDSDQSSLYCSIPVSLPSEHSSAGSGSQTSLLVPCSKLPAGAKNGQPRFRVQLQSVDLSAKDLQLLCKSSDTMAERDPVRDSDERAHLAAYTDRRHSLEMAALNATRTGDNSSQHSGEASPWGHQNPAIAPGEPDNLNKHLRHGNATDGMFLDGAAGARHCKDLDGQEGDKEERRFRSARLQKRAQREGPRLTQVDFDDTMMNTSKRRRTNSECANTSARPDVLSGIIGKRVVVPRRSRTAAPASQALRVASPPSPGAQPAAQQQTQSEQPTASQRPNIRTTNPAPYAAMSPIPKDEEQFAVMGLLSLCKAN